MASSQRPRRWFLLLIAALSFSAEVSNATTWPDTLALYERFAKTPRFVTDSNFRSEEHLQLSTHCQILNLRCISFVSTHAELARASLPDNPEYWTTYDAVLHSPPTPLEHIDPDHLPSYNQIIEGSIDWVHRALVTHDFADTARLHRQIVTHRRRLAQASYLLERMVFEAALGITLPAINVHMARRGQTPSAADEQLLDDMLRKLTLEEVSIRRTLQGERRYAAELLKTQTAIDSDEYLDEQKRVFDFVALRSEASWEDFWREGIDVTRFTDIPQDADVLNTPWRDYAASVRHFDASLEILRVLRSWYKDRSIPGVPTAPAPYGWAWVWKEDSRELCLHPASVHVSVAPIEPLHICHTYFQSSDFKRVEP